jgi:WD40 repeat protein
VNVEPPSLARLVAQLESDQWDRWQQGRLVPAEEYLAAHPRLLTEPELALRLIYGEFTLREKLGEPPTLEEFQRRFPAFAERLALQVKLHQALQEVPPTGSMATANLASGTPAVTEDRIPSVGGARSTSEPDWPSIPGYEILDELGRGGMGVVYKARQTRLKRLVALKMIRAGACARADDLARFRTEAESVARLQHPNIVQVHEVGECAGMPFFSLEFVEGGSLDRKLRGQPQPPRETAVLVEALARAVHAAHCHGIVHRDLKPANVLLQRLENQKPERSGSDASFEFLISSFSPKIADFGLAKQLDSDSGQTRSGAIMGTPSYMAPEQAAGNNAQVGPLADVYALGAILYEMLTGRAPFRGPTPLDTVFQVVHHDPIPPTRLQPHVPRDVETICLKCLQKDPHKRFASALDLAEDLARFGAGEPIRARPIGLAERAAKWARRRPGVAALSAAMILTIVVSFVVISAQLQETRAALGAEKVAKGVALEKTTIAEKAQHAERERADELRVQLYNSEMSLAYEAFRDGRLGLMLELLEKQRPQPGQADLRQAEWYCLWKMCHREQRKFGSPGGDRQFALTLSPDGSTLTTGDGAGMVRSWDLGSGKLRHSQRHCENVVYWDPAAKSPKKVGVFALALAPDGKTLAVGGGPGQDFGAGFVHVCDPETLAVRQALPDHGMTVYGLAYSPNGAQLATACFDGVVRVYDARTLRLLHSLRGQQGSAGTVAYSPDSKTLASGGQGGVVHVWSAEDGRKIASVTVGLRSDNELIHCLAYSRDGKRLAVGGGTAAVVFLNPDNWAKPYKLYVNPWERVYSLAFSSDGTRFAVGLSRGNLSKCEIWDSTGSRRLAEFLGHADAITALAFSRDNRALATTSIDGTARLWDASIQPLEPIVSLAFAPDGKTMATTEAPASGSRSSVSLWNVLSQTKKAVYAHKKSIASVAISPDGRWLAAAEGRAFNLFGSNNPVEAQPSDVILRDLTTGEPGMTLKGSDYDLYAVAYSPDGRWLASGGLDTIVKIWDAKTGREVRALGRVRWPIRGLAFSPDSRLLAAACGERWNNVASDVRLWEAATGKEEAVLKTRSPAEAVAFSPDGKMLAAGLVNADIELWDVATRQSQGQLQAHVQAVWALTFSPDGRRLASLGLDNRLRLWNLATRREAGTINVLRSYAVAFSPNGELLVNGEGLATGGVVFWKLAPGPENDGSR